MLGALLARCVRLACRFRAAVLVLAVASAGGSLLYAAEHLGVNTSTTDMFSPALEWRQAHSAYRREFPQFADTLTVVIDAAAPELADAAARALSAALAADDTRFAWSYVPGSGEFFDRNALLYLDDADLTRLVDRMAKAQPLLGRLATDPSLRGLFGLLQDIAEAQEDLRGLELDYFYRALAAAIEAGLAGRFEPVSWQGVTAGEAPSAEDRRRFVIAKPRLDFRELYPARDALARVRALAGELGLVPEQGVRLRLTGSAALAEAELESVTRGASRAGIGALVGVALILIWGLGSLRLVGCALLSLLVGLSWTLLFAATVVGHLNLISIAFAVLYIGLGIDYAIHYALRFRELVQAGHGTDEALATAAGDVGQSLVLCSLTTGIGFFAFIPTDFAGVSELGLISGTGMFISLLASLTVLPAALSALRSEPRPAGAGTVSPLLARIDGWEWRHRRAVLGATVVLVALSAGLAARVEFDLNPLALQDPETEAVATYLELMREKDAPTWTAVVLERSAAKTRELEEALAALPTVESVRTLFDFVPEDPEAKLERVSELELLLGGVLEARPRPPPDRAATAAALDALLGAVAAFSDATSPTGPRTGLGPGPDARRLVSALAALRNALGAPQTEAGADVVGAVARNVLVTLEPVLARLRTALGADVVTEAALPPDLVERWRSPDGTYRLEVEARGDLNDNDALRRFVESVRAVAPGATDTPVLHYEASRAVIAAFRDAFLYAAALITVVLAFAFRNAADVLLVLGSVALASLVATAGLVALGLSFNFANVIALPLLLGIGVDNGIHILHRMRGTRPQPGGFLATSTARGVVVSAATTICGFGNLAFSPHRGMASMGTLLTLGLIATVLCTVIILPVVLAWRTERRLGAAP